MKVSSKKLLPLIVFAIAVTSLFSVRPAQAGYIVILQQVGSDVVATGSGAIDLTGLSLLDIAGGSHAVIVPNAANVQTGPSGLELFKYSGFSGPTNFGSGGQTVSSSGTGDFVGISGTEGFLWLPFAYVSGSPLSDSATYDGATFSSLGVTPGTYEWTWGPGDDQNFTLEIVLTPNNINDCKNNGWQTLTHGDGSPFRNQGQCIQYVNTGK
jgi:hypothetical protein